MPESSYQLWRTALSLWLTTIVLCVAPLACAPREQSAFQDLIAKHVQHWRASVELSALPKPTCDTIFLAAPHRSCEPPTRVGQLSELRALAELEATLSAEYAARPTAAVAHQLGVVQLVAAMDSVGLERAIGLFSNAVLAEPLRNDYSNDLSAALLLRYRDQRTLPDLLHAAELATTTANRAHPDRQSCWNAIVSLAWLSLREQLKHTRAHCESSCERQECRLPVIIDDSPPIATDARAIALDGRWTDASWDYATTHLLPAWAQSLSDGDRAREGALRRDLLRVHALLAQRSADSSIGRALESISQAPAGSARQRALLRATALHAEFRLQSNLREPAEAEALLDSISALTRPSDQLRLWTDLYRANRVLTSGRSNEALQSYRALGAGLLPPETVLGERLAYNEALAIMTLGDQVGGLQRLEAHAERCSALARDECAFKAHAMAASVATLVGDDERSEQNTQRALESSVVPMGTSRWSLLSVLRQTAEVYGYSTIADLLHQEAEQVAQQLARPDLEVQELTLRAHNRARQRDSVGLQRLISALDTTLSTRLNVVDREFYRAERWWLEGEYRFLTGRSGARAVLDSSVAQMASDSNSARQLRPRLSLARAIAREGDSTAALLALDSLLRSLEARNGSQSSPFDRVRLSENALAVGEAAAELLRERNAPGALLRALSAMPFINSELPTWDVDSTRLDLAVRRLGDTVLLWFRRGGDWRVRTINLPERTLRESISTLQMAQLAALFSALIEPILVSAGPAVRSLRVDARGDLSAVPWAALYSERTQQFLVERFAVWQTEDVWQRIDAERTPRHARVVVIDAAPRSGQRALPGAQDEVYRTQAIWGRQSDRLDGTSGAAHILARIPAYDVVHFAGHAVLHASRPERSYLELPSASDARVTGIHIASKPLGRTQLVVLAACDTRGGTSASAATSRFGSGMLSLASAFREAGAKYVIGASWAIDDEATAVMMERLHVSLRAGASPANALREAQLAALRSPDPTLRSPRVWAAFQLLGS